MLAFAVLEPVLIPLNDTQFLEILENQNEKEKKEREELELACNDEEAGRSIVVPPLPPLQDNKVYQFYLHG